MSDIPNALQISTGTSDVAIAKLRLTRVAIVLVAIGVSLFGMAMTFGKLDGAILGASFVLGATQLTGY